MTDDDLFLPEPEPRDVLATIISVDDQYPHGDSTWPDTQAVIEAAWGHLLAAGRRQLCCENAAALFRHPLPERVLPEGPST